MLLGATEQKMIQNRNTNFSDFVRSLMASSDYGSYRKLYKTLSERDCDFSYSTLTGYCNGNVCPTPEKARQIISAFDYPIDEEELDDLLNQSKNMIREMDQSEKYIQHGVRIPVNYFGLPKAKLEISMSKRAEEVTGKDKSFNAYICYLIKEDLTKSGILES